MEYSPRIPEVENVLGKIGQHLYPEDKESVEQHTDMMQVNFQIQQNIGILINLSNQEHFHQIKLALASNVLREHDKQHIHVNISIPSTVFGETFETLEWNFAIEGRTTDNPVLETYADSLLAQWNEKNKDGIEQIATNLRFSTLIQSEHCVKNLFESIDNQLGSENKTGATFLTAMALFDLEKLSASRQTDMLIYQDLYNKENVLDQWLACLDIHAVYQKPLISFNTYLIH